MLKFISRLALVAVTTLASSGVLAANGLDDRDQLEQLLGTALGCEISRNLMGDTDPEPFYVAGAGSCTIASDVDAGTYFTDEQCQNSFDYKPTTLLNFCIDTLDKTKLGNADDLQQVEQAWTLSPGNRYDLGSRSLDGLVQPYMTRVSYKEVATTGGTCRLEMRIYKSSPTATGLKSVIAYHGGSWTSRGFGYFGLEMTAPHFTNQGFVVFAPFYRLLDAKEGNPACHNATIQQITEDAGDALEWVVAHASEWGASDYPVVFGQSAGGHLAASVSVHKPELVSNAVLYYPPTDFTDFAQRIISGEYTNEQGLDILQRVIGGPASTVDVSASPVPENTFPSIVEPNPENYPPMFFLHGLADDLVEARQSLRLCSALNGAVSDSDNFTETSALRQTLDCDDRGSQLHLIKQGNHALDVCFIEAIVATDACPAGSAASRDLVADSMTASVSWASTVADQRLELRDQEANPTPVDDVNTGGGGGGSLSLMFLTLLSFGAWFRHARHGYAKHPG